MYINVHYLLNMSNESRQNIPQEVQSWFDVDLLNEVYQELQHHLRDNNAAGENTNQIF